MNWHETILGKNITTKKGFAFKSTKYVDSGVPIVRVSDFTSDSISANDLKYYPKEEKYTYLDYELHYKDIIIQTVGSWPNNPDSVVGKVVRVPYELNNALLNQNAVKIIPNEGIDNDFLYYRLKSSDFSGHVVGQARGAANQASITLETIKSFKFFIPNYNVQIKIGKVISQYDRLLENNNKRIKILEQMAENLYKEWFVRFRFPGHENAEFVDGVPKGWRYRKLNDISSFCYGKMPIKEHIVKEKGYPIFSGYSINGYYDTYMYNDRKLVLIARGVGGTGDVVIAPAKSYITNLSIIFNMKNEQLLMEYLYQRFKLQNLKYLDTGAAQSQITIENLKCAKVLIPSVKCLEEFNKVVFAIQREQLVLESKKQNLIKQRDLLLPRLMSGKLQVK